MRIESSTLGRRFFERCRWNEPGFAKRLFLNVAYKRVEPFYRLLGQPLSIGWLRPLFHWYARPFTSRYCRATRPGSTNVAEAALGLSRKRTPPAMLFGPGKKQPLRAS